MTFLIDEETALKEYLKGLTVTDDKNPARPVGVWFGHPDQEIRQQSYPYITIDLIDISEAPERAHRGFVEYPYTPSGYEATDTTLAGQFPIPVNIDYQISTYSRQPRHDRQIIEQLLNGPLPMRFGTLNIADGSVRRLDFLGFAKRDTTENEKRLFVNIFNVRISSELIPYQLQDLYRVGEVNISLQTILTKFEINQ